VHVPAGSVEVEILRADGSSAHSRVETMAGAILRVELGRE
jgi:hypothetical protein